MEYKLEDQEHKIVASDYYMILDTLLETLIRLEKHEKLPSKVVERYLTATGEKDFASAKERFFARHGDKKLRACPFCGSHGSIVSHYDINLDVKKAICRDITCCASTTYYASEEEAIRAWNEGKAQRPDLSEIRQRTGLS